MFIFPGMLIGPAKEAGIKVPPDAKKFDTDEYPHFRVYLNCQLGAAMPTPTSHWSNARVVASVPDHKIKTVNYIDLLEMGFEVGYPRP
jgi:hypothetical protein